MTLKTGTYLVARSGAGRPTLMHKLQFLGNGEVLTLCGRDTSKWSRAYLATPIPQILCRRCAG